IEFSPADVPYSHENRCIQTFSFALCATILSYRSINYFQNLDKRVYIASFHSLVRRTPCDLQSHLLPHAYFQASKNPQTVMVQGFLIAGGA
ncbi:MAG: hypothetical protein RR337_13115, partial [Clostridia bacterium]